MTETDLLIALEGQFIPCPGDDPIEHRARTGNPSELIQHYYKIAKAARRPLDEATRQFDVLGIRDAIMTLKPTTEVPIAAMLAPKIAEIISAVSQVTGVPVPHIKSARRQVPLERARMIVYWLAYQHTSCTMTTIARLLCRFIPRLSTGLRKFGITWGCFQRTSQRLKSFCPSSHQYQGSWW